MREGGPVENRVPLRPSPGGPKVAGRDPVSVVASLCALAAILGAVVTVIQAFNAPQSCSFDVNRPHFPAYPAMALGLTAIVLGVIGATTARSSVLKHGRLGFASASVGGLAIVVAFMGLVFYGPLAC